MTQSRRLLGQGDVSVRAGRVDQKTAVFTIDVESDYNSPQYEALEQLGEFLAVAAELELPLTAFVEGQFFENRPHIPKQLVAAGVDVQLHCFDHTTDGDGPAELAKGVAAYSTFMGHPPAGYRAHTYRLTPDLYEALLAHGFAWDTSILPGRVQGSNSESAFRTGDYLVLDEKLIEFPVAAWPKLPIPLIHSYRLMLRPTGERIVRSLVGLPNLVVYDMHMADLVWSNSLQASPLPKHVKWAYRYMWTANRPNTFNSLRTFVAGLRGRGYIFRTMSELHAEVSKTSPKLGLGL